MKSRLMVMLFLFALVSGIFSESYCASRSKERKSPINHSREAAAPAPKPVPTEKELCYPYPGGAPLPSPSPRAADKNYFFDCP